MPLLTHMAVDPRPSSRLWSQFRAFAYFLANIGFLAIQPGTFAETGPGQWIVVAPAAFAADLKPLIELRENEGFRAIVMESSNNPANGESVLVRLKEVVKEHEGKNYVLLAGAPTLVPSFRGNVARMNGQETDTGYGIPDADGAPTVAVGRFPARDEQELRGMIQKSLRFEEDGRPAAWPTRLLLLIGDPGGGMLPDLYVQSTLDADLARLDPAWSVRAMFNVPSSRFFYPRIGATQAALDSLKAGEFLALYLGHSGPGGMEFIGRTGFQTVEIPRGNGPFFTCGCFALQPDGKAEGYGLAAMRNPAGPSAVIGATGETYSAAGQLAAEGLLTCLAKAPFPGRLGDYWLAVATGLARGKMDEITYALLDAEDGSRGKETLATMRHEHLEMWGLLGDPAMRMPAVPQDIVLDAMGNAAASKTLTVTGTLPKRLEGAAVQLTLERPLNSQPLDLADVPTMTAENREEVFRTIAANNQRANEYVIASTNAKANGARFSRMLALPEKLPWDQVILRAYATVSNETALGVRVLRVHGKAAGDPP